MRKNKVLIKDTYKNAISTINLSHYYGFGENRKKVLDNININIK